MKKVLALLMVALFALSLCACGAPTVQEAINGSAWEMSIPYQSYVISTRLEFNDGVVVSQVSVEGLSSTLDPEEGTYVVNDDGTISIHWNDEGNDVTYYYKYENEILRLSIDEDWGDMELERAY